VLFSGFTKKYGEIEKTGRINRISEVGSLDIVYIFYESTNDKG